MESALFKDREWRKEIAFDEYVITTSTRNFNIDWVNAAFASGEMYWAKPLPREQISIMLSQSLNLGLFHVEEAVPDPKNERSPSSPRTPSPPLEDQPQEKLKQVGMARFITDYVTFAYLTDVYIDADHRGFGLGEWLVGCCRQVMEGMPAMRRGMLLTSPEVGKRFYSRELGFYDVLEEKDHMICMTRRAYNLNEA